MAIKKPTKKVKSTPKPIVPIAPKRTYQYGRLSNGLLHTVCRRLRSGCFQETAWAAVGVPLATYTRWMSLGKKALLANNGKVPLARKTAKERRLRAYAKAFLRCERAKAIGIAKRVSNVERGALTDWKAAAWLLQHGPGKNLYREAETTHKHEHSGPGGKPIETHNVVDISGLPFDKRKALLELLEAQETAVIDGKTAFPDITLPEAVMNQQLAEETTAETTGNAANVDTAAERKDGIS